MEITDKNLKIAKDYNLKLYPIYKMFSWDLLFYYSIFFIFFTQVKGFTASSLMFGNSFYPIFKFIFQIPCLNFIEKFGKRISVILGNILISISIALVIFCTNIIVLIFINLMMSVGYNLKGLCEYDLLHDCIEDSPLKSSIFSKIDGKGSSLHYYFDAISSCFTGFLFVINPYLPILICFSICVISILISLNFKTFEIKNTNLNEKNRKYVSYISFLKDLKFSFKNLLKSSRLKSLLAFSGIFSGVISISITLISSLFTNLNIPEKYYGIILAILTFFSAVSSNKQEYFHKKYKNKLLTYFSITFSLSMLVIGLITYSNLNIHFTIIICFVLISIQYIIKGPYWTFIYKYLNNFTTTEITTKIYSINMLIESILNTLISLLCSWLLGITSTFVTYIILGSILTLVFIFLMDYMKSRVGLKPEDYSKEDINYIDLK